MSIAKSGLLGMTRSLFSNHLPGSWSDLNQIYAIPLKQ